VVYYNEHDPFAAQWLRRLIHAGHLPMGDVDTRSIEDVHPYDLAPYTQHHFFAGIGGWAYALQLAGWPEDEPIWTGSCPCQPFSAAGKGLGFADERHLWPAWFHLISECDPAVLVGEQVDKALDWLDLVYADLEGAGYAVGAVGLPAASVGAFHIRQRLWFVAESEGARGWADVGSIRRGARQGLRESQRQVERRPIGEAGRIGDCVTVGDMGDTGRSGLSEQRSERGTSRGQVRADAGETTIGTSASTFWSGCDWLPCVDGKARPVEPGTFPLAHGVPARVGRLRGYGNAIVPQVAQAFLEAYLEVRHDSR
jgi:DNA (cytosine-5)-methyltransferase 1